ncbi:MAG: hypothetical protein H0W73_07925 [Bacteroidetes bacterium]|nr:hypothetical protein [Bacteroidota bacterium]
MNRSFHILILIFVAQFQYLTAQDTLVFHTGERKVANITEINPVEIKYTRYGTETPLYVVNIKEVFWIKYQNGIIDTINKFNVVAINYSPNKLQLLNTRIYNSKGPLNDDALWVLLYNYPKVNIRDQLILRYKELERQRKIHLGSFLLGLGSGYVSLYSIPFAVKENAGIPVVAVGAAALGSGIYFFIKSRKKIRESKTEIVDIYNKNL